MNVLHLLSLFLAIKSVFCTNFRTLSDSHKAEDIAEISDGGVDNQSGSLHETQSPGSLENIILEQERPVLLNTIPQTKSKHILFVNSTGLFTNLTVELTATIPIAMVSPENDSIHRILSHGNVEGINATEVKGIVSKNNAVQFGIEEMIKQAFELSKNNSIATEQSNSTESIVVS
ncbi:hypothetical protein FG386_000763 [Cryptosporidium ryanae]|uniref:uncharacterized protein n=1 Tax=Cryptosporidium ryanae TaxID=515981 RepID=UPI003519F3D9|nr:hypothetical protein FG386_000763 [Cryptosporidium ryanae]